MSLQILKEYLVNLEYPESQEMDDEQVADVFHLVNRVKFLKWAMEKLGYNEFPNSETGLTLTLAEMVYCNGFCSKKQKQSFVTGSPKKLSPLDELQIFMRIFEFLKLLKKAEAREAPPEVFTTEDLVAFKNAPLPELYPGCWEPQLRQKRDEKIKNFADRMAKVQSEISALKSEIEPPEIPHGDSQTSSDKIIPHFDLSGGDEEKVEIDFDIFKYAVCEFSKIVDNLKVDEGRDDGAEMRAELGKCMELSGLFCQFSNNLEILRDFKKNVFPLPRCSSQAHDDVSKAAKMSAETLECRKFSEL